MENKLDQKLIDDFYQKCRNATLSVTPQRLAIYKALVQDTSHPRPEKIHAKIISEFPTISLATVYKTCETFEKHNIISRVTPLHNTVRYDSITKRHHHIICVKCKKIIDLFDSKLDDFNVPRKLLKEYSLLEFSVHFFVVCQDCQ